MFTIISLRSSSSSISKQLLQSRTPSSYKWLRTLTIDNPLLGSFEFPPFDAIDAAHVRPGMRSLLQKLEGDLVELEKSVSVETSWPKLVEPLEKMKDRLSVVWGAINHLRAVKDSYEFRSAIEEIQPEKVQFDLKLGQSKPIYNAFKAIKESSDWEGLSDAQKRIVEFSQTYQELQMLLSIC